MSNSSFEIANFNTLYLSLIKESFISFSSRDCLLASSLNAICCAKFEGDDVVLLKKPWVFSNNNFLKLSSLV